MKADVSLDFQFTSTIEQVWNALTDSDTLAQWIWDNDFKPGVGHKFQFRAEPSEWWDGIVDSEVLEVDEPNRLSYTWVSAGESTTVTWTLKKGSDGTIHLHLDQTGFSEATKARKGAIEGAKYAWTNMGEQLEKVLTAQ
ncbi:SRPBCC family protein [Lysinibacillus sp. NPDC048646]|uniref:SRPBCC family protein n=1 Tax=Lysinibacillus sp. NPDC048646 TaxID=3390574 RepID=UPI003D0634BB